MIIKNLKDSDEFTAGDGCLLRELLHADKGKFNFHYSLAHARVKSEGITSPHKLKSTEVYYILEGNGIMCINEESQPVSPGCAVYIPADSTQYIKNTGKKDLIFLCIVEPAWRIEDEEIKGEK
ncbi:MAG: cupin domain-containing protein [Candidatus Omnitrophota bacterium]